jgi:hypothetical protein
MSLIKVTTTWENPNPDTVWNRLAARLGREPTDEEACQEVRRIYRDEPVPSNHGGRPL